MPLCCGDVGSRTLMLAGYDRLNFCSIAPHIKPNSSLFFSEFMVVCNLVWSLVSSLFRCCLRLFCLYFYFFIYVDLGLEFESWSIKSIPNTHTHAFSVCKMFALCILDELARFYSPFTILCASTMVSDCCNSVVRTILR